jgi:ABC-type multidrug transport system ATPase subunit
MNSIVQCVDLSKNYSRTKALQSVTLELEAGSPIALVGPNGAGKTTLLSLLCGYIRPSSGEVTVMGQRAGSLHAIRHMSALPQDASLDPHFSVGVQLKHYARLRGMKDATGEVTRVLRLVQMEDRIAAKGTQLSHGMRKRVLLAQALIGSPTLVLLDEPTAGIDPPNVKIIRELIGRQATEATFIVSSHNLDELEKVCRTVVHLSDGKLSKPSTMSTTRAC